MFLITEKPQSNIFIRTPEKYGYGKKIDIGHIYSVEDLLRDYRN
jgi:hypothetical protein